MAEHDPQIAPARRAVRGFTEIHIFCPIYEPYPGGGGTYFPLLAHYWAQHYPTTVHTEYHGDHRISETTGRLTVLRSFLRRDTLTSKSRISSAIRYLVNSILFIAKILKIALMNPNAVVIFTRNYHAHYLRAMRLAKRLQPTLTFVHDMRTELPPKFEAIDLRWFDVSFSNSLAIEAQLSRLPNMKGRHHTYLKNMVKLPTEKDISRPDIDLDPKGFVLFCGTLSLRKSVDIVVPVAKLLFERLGLAPVLIGRPADYDTDWLEAQLRGVPYVYRERLPHAQILWLERNAALVMLPSRMEGLPRVVIETLTFHGHVVLPPCCPEFDDGLTVDTLSVETVLAKALQRIETPYVGYDVAQHDPQTGLDAYRAFVERHHPIHH